MTHRELCIIAAKHLRNKGIQYFTRCQYVVCELERANAECPDAFGFGSSSSQLIEAKNSRSDFLSDKNKHWRKHPKSGLGNFRSYLCPENIILPDELPEKWGLLYLDSKNKVVQIVEPEWQESNHAEELNLITSLFRRLDIRPQVFSYKKYIKDSELTIDFEN